MEAIYIPQLLKAPQHTEEISFSEFIEGLETLTPVKGKMIVSHQGTYLEVAVVAETIITLSCDRCLQNYNHRLSLNTSEMIWLDKSDKTEEYLPLEREVAVEDLSESLDSMGYFAPGSWLYEQLCLAMPVRQLCSNDCQPPSYQTGDNQVIIDSRWSSLAALKENFSNHEL
jgi:uncharacterized protein